MQMKVKAQLEGLSILSRFLIYNIKFYFIRFATKAWFKKNSRNNSQRVESESLIQQGCDFSNMNVACNSSCRKKTAYKYCTFLQHFDCTSFTVTTGPSK
jgi:hypothetical protein